MGKESRRELVLPAVSIIRLLGFYLLYATFSSSSHLNLSESWRNQLSDWRKMNQSVEVRDSLAFLVRRLVRGDDRIRLDGTGFSCHSDVHFDVCVANKPVKFDNNALTVYLPNSSPTNATQIKRLLHPYPLKDDETAMKAVTPLHILPGNTYPPACRYTHNVPAVIFSTGGFSGNIFREFNDLIIPLFITCRHFRSRVQFVITDFKPWWIKKYKRILNRLYDLIIPLFITCRHFRSRVQFVITDFKPWWIKKYKRILNRLSQYEGIDSAVNGSGHCFPGAVVGLQYHKNLGLNSSEIPGGYSMFEFRQFLKETYNLKTVQVQKTEKKKPLLILVSRNKTIRFMNEDEMVEMMEEVGFRVLVTTPDMMSDLDNFSMVVNSCSVMLGAHGAGLTNELFLAAGAVVVQVVPLGLQWSSDNYFGGPAVEMGLNYLEYRIEAKESSLLDVYGPDHPVIVDPNSISLKGYRASRAVYIDGQDLKINVGRFRETLVEAMKIVGQSSS